MADGSLPSLDSYGAAQRIAPQTARYDRERDSSESEKKNEPGSTAVAVSGNNPIPGASRGSIINILV